MNVTLAMKDALEDETEFEFRLCDLPDVPRAGDEVALGSAEDVKYYVVQKVVWLADAPGGDLPRVMCFVFRCPEPE